ncbi:ERF family protein [Ectopseudomonas mendocina]|nr:ERF family protein [Pseudomonas mendocina]
MEQNNEMMAKLYAALACAQAEYAPLAKNRQVTIRTKAGGSYEFRYADLEAVFSSTRPALAKHGIGFVQTIQPANGRSALVTMLAHKDGGTLSSTIEFNMPSGGDIKDFGAHLTYLRRYAATAILGVAADDDLDEDGTGAGEGEATEQAKPAAEQRATTGKPPYPDAKLQEMLPKWRALIASDQKSADRVIATVSSGNTLTEDQIAQIRALEEEEAQA